MLFGCVDAVTEGHITMKKTVVVLGDCHGPFHSGAAIKRAIEIAKELYDNNPKNTVVCQVGDLFDALSHSKFPKSMNAMTPKQEMDKARDFGENLWLSIKKACPKAQCFQLLGNHDIRPYKRILERYPEAESMLSLRELYEFPGVETVHDYRDPLIIDDVLYTHGFLGGVGRHLNYFQRSVVFGHLHTAHIHYQKRKDGLHFEMTVGYLADPKSIALSYTPTTFSKWVQGIGVIDQYGPRFIPL